MNKIVKIKNKEILINIKSYANARSLKLSVEASGRVLLTKPRRLSQKILSNFIKDRLNWLEEAFRKININSNISYLNDASVNFRKNKNQARKLVLERLNKFLPFYQVKPQKVNIRNQRTRWGSCSRQGNLSFNYRLLFLNPKMVDYIIVHEICHLQEFNHSSSFWRLVAKTIPDYNVLRKELKNIKIK